MCESAEKNLALGKKELVRPLPTDAATSEAQGERPKLHEGDLYLCAESQSALEGALGAVCEGVESVLSDNSTKRAFVCIRPPGHHCSSDYPSGFCWLNNVHVGISHAAQYHGLTHAAIIDFDLHHGDGSQSITWVHNARVAGLSKNTPMSKKTAIGYFSLHDINSYPCENGDEDKVRNASLCIENAHGQNIWNVHLQPWTTLDEFWRLYEERYTVLLQKARTFLRSHSNRLRTSSINPHPKAVIFLSAGFDASEWESSHMQRHKVNVPTDFYARFTRDVVRLAEEEGLGVDGRVISVLEGGYSDRALMSGVLSHLSGLVPSLPRPGSSGSNSGLGQEMGRRLGRLSLNGEYKRESVEPETLVNESLRSEWWALSQLEALEKLVNPSSAPGPPKKARNALPPTFISQTQSSAAKIISPPAGRRSVSGSGYGFQTQPNLALLPEVPPPSVDWSTAAHELAKLLIPSDRQTLSCKAEDLNAEASRIRRDRHSEVGLPAAISEEIPGVDGKRMQLRERKGKSPKYTSEEEEEKRVTSRAGRRKTIDPSVLGQDAVENIVPKPVAKVPSRRLSVASSVGSVTGDRMSITDAISSRATPLPLAVTTSNPLPVRKTRSPSKPRAEPTAVKSRITKKAPPVPRVPPDFSRSGVPTPSGFLSRPTANGVSSGPLIENEQKKNHDIDSLASGMKKMTIKLGLPKSEGQVIDKKRPDTGIVKKKPAARGRPKGSTTTNNATGVRPTVDMKASLKPAEDMPLKEAPRDETSEAVGLGIDTDATQEETGGEPLASTTFKQISIADNPTRHQHVPVIAEETGKLDANNDVDEMEPGPEASSLPPSATIPVADHPSLSGDPKPRPSTFIPPEQPTIPAEAPVGAGKDLPGFPSQPNSQYDESIDPTLFSTAPTSQALDTTPSFAHAQIIPQPPPFAPDFQHHHSHQVPLSSFAHAPPPPPSRPTTSSSTASSPKRMQHTRDNLPVFTANSSIPFGNNNNSRTHDNIATAFVSTTPSSNQLQQEAATVPPLRESKPPQQGRDLRMDVGNLIDQTTSGDENKNGGARQEDNTLWDIPSTPQSSLGGGGRKR